MLFAACLLGSLVIALTKPLDELEAARIADREVGTQGRLESLVCAQSQPVDPGALALVTAEATLLLPNPSQIVARFPFPAVLLRMLITIAALHVLAPLVLPPPITPPREPLVTFSETRRGDLREAATEIRRIYLDHDAAERLAARLERLAAAESLTRRDFLKETAAARFERDQLENQEHKAATLPTDTGRDDLATALDAAGRLLDGEPGEGERALNLQAIEQMAKRNEAVAALHDLARALRDGNTAEAELARAKVEALLGRKVRTIDRDEFARLLSEGRLRSDPTLGGTKEIVIAPCGQGTPGESNKAGTGGNRSTGETGTPEGSGAAEGSGAPGATGAAESSNTGDTNRSAGAGAGAGAAAGRNPDPVVRTGFDAAQSVKETKVKGASANGEGERARIRGEGILATGTGSDRQVTTRAESPLTPSERSALRDGEERFLKDYFETLTGTKDGGQK